MTMPGPDSIVADAVPRLARGVRMVESAAHGGRVLLAPERLFKLDEVAAAVLDLCDGTRSVAAVVDDLAGRYTAPRDRILADVSALLRSLADKRLVEL
ncbi:pyrroloquinoline quinone biosynthesis peptide chaperone PqqD [Rhodoplanes sp. TEM]|uniref:Pyrroloquinoline quinone biosynthesis peptide chaperone PqqD n=1 Tax=Rhodoplanes tepidamans TaxID=200616 RepID=A0ABT5JH51_RHOTP|nr:pyrroloquinoline quinone biosynthesis peptide chaperone PqqD [Rhodoplanes tepidamans]MDC7788907.1 pyrroloquinoline quinone biosynthesis peptide chaperone PqqD [Rhodoplanes tepidamans]MDC7985614.1 pyrroloquinoline quinone biosynthesis peptide chaperone PqqD [Rhodoplanes sp. TEM]MDQ0358758.1 pyrroloquinoline quinone biosynthesis protein D [Rhodoplanes tepidamans]